MLYYIENQDGFRLSLLGCTITLFSRDGTKIDQWFFDDKHKAKNVFMSLVG